MVAAEQGTPVTCLSDDEHTHTIGNHVLHYPGCIEICERERFFEVDSELYRFELEQVYRRLLRESKGEQEYRRMAKAKEWGENVE